MNAKRLSGLWRLACGHVISRALDPEQRTRCPFCKSDTIVVADARGSKRP